MSPALAGGFLSIALSRKSSSPAFFFKIFEYLKSFVCGCIGSQLWHTGYRACRLSSFGAGALQLWMHGLSYSTACGILVPPLGIKHSVPYIGRQILNHWTTREVPPAPLAEETVFPPLSVFTSFVIDYLTMDAWFYLWSLCCSIDLYFWFCASTVLIQGT